MTRPATSRPPSVSCAPLPATAPSSRCFQRSGTCSAIRPTQLAGAEPLDGPTISAARAWARELGIHLIAGSIAERVEGQEKAFNTSTLIGPDGELEARYRKIHMFDVDVGGVVYRESDHDEPGDEVVSAALGAPLDGVTVGLTVCYDLRFPELYRILAVRGATVITVPSAFTLDTGKDHWEVLLRARAIENQAFVVGAEPGRRGAAPLPLLRPLRDRRPLGRRPGAGPRRGVLRRRRPRSRAPRARPRDAAVPGQPPPGLIRVARGGARPMMAKAPPVDKRRQILDAAIHVFARQGFHACRVSDIADEAGVAYGLVYHYFNSKDEVLNELFTERWSLLLAAIEEVDGQAIGAREKLDAVARFIVDSYRYEPDLMKVIIVEVTRAANSFGRTHLPEIRRAYDMIAKIVADAQRAGTFRKDVDPEFASMWFYGAIEQLLSGWVFELIPGGEADFDRAREMVVETICGGLEAGAMTGRRPGGAARCGNHSQPLAGDRVLHGAAKLLNVVVGVIALPLWLLGQRLRDPFRRLLARLDADPAPLPVAQPRERSMGALMADLESIPHHLHHSDARDGTQGPR